MQANVTYRRLSGDELLQEIAWKTMLAEIDYNSSMSAAEERGMERGAHDKAVETARTLLTLGVNTLEQIAQATGLSLAEIEQLANTAHVQ